MKSGYRVRVFGFLVAVGIFLVVGLIGVFNSKSVIEEKMAETMVSSRLRALAFEGISVLNEGSLKGEGHAITEEEAKKIQLVFGKMEELQKALVNGSQIYEIPDSKSPALNDEILKSSAPVLSALESVSRMIHSDKTWQIGLAQQSINDLHVYADEMSSVTAMVLSEGDDAKGWSKISFLVLTIGAFILIIGAYFISLKPILKRITLSDQLIAETRKEIELSRVRWSQSLFGLHQQFRLPGFGFQNVLTKLSESANSQNEKRLVNQLESSFDFYSELVDEMRLLAEMETQTYQSRRSIIDLHSFLETTTSEVNKVVGAEKCTILVELSDDLPTGLVQDQQLLHHCIIQVLTYQLVVMRSREIKIRVGQLNHDSGLVQVKFSFISTENESVSKQESAVLFDEQHRLEITQKFVEKLGGKLSIEPHQTFFTVVFETGDSIELNDMSKLIGLKAALFLNDTENQLFLKRQLSSWGVYAVPFSKVGMAEELEAVLSKFHFCIADTKFLKSRGEEVIHALNRKMEQQSILFFVVCKEQERTELAYSFVRGFLTDPISVDELMKLLLNFSHVIFRQNVRSVDKELKSKSKLNFLVVHPDDLMRTSAQRNIQVMGYQCDTASNPREAISALGRKEYDVLFAESTIFSSESAAFSRHLKMLNNQGSDMVVIEINDSETIQDKFKQSSLIDQSISRQVGVKEVQSVVNEWFEV